MCISFHAAVHVYLYIQFWIIQWPKVKLSLRAWVRNKFLFLYDHRRQRICGRVYKNGKNSISGGQTLKKSMKTRRAIYTTRRHTQISSARALSNKMQYYLLMVYPVLFTHPPLSNISFKVNGALKTSKRVFAMQGQGITFSSRLWILKRKFLSTSRSLKASPECILMI